VVCWVLEPRKKVLADRILAYGLAVEGKHSQVFKLKHEEKNREVWQSAWGPGAQKGTSTLGPLPLSD
jgi:hypothetical protein